MKPTLFSINRSLLKTNILPDLKRFSTTVMENCKKIAGYKAVDEHVKDGMIIGVGSGSTIKYAVERIAERYNQEKLTLKCVPTSYQSRLLIKEYNLPLEDLETCPSLDLTIDGADEVDSEMNAIKGGGACLTQEKIVAYNSKELVLIADYTKRSEYLGETWKKGIPIEVIPLAQACIKKELEKIGGVAELRIAAKKAGPVVTDNTMFIIDWKYNKEDGISWREINEKVKMIPGVVETGLFIGMASKAYFGLEDGTVAVRESPQ